MGRPAADPDARRERTLFVALLLSAWAPFVTGWAVVLSQSTTQVADFVRRTVELAAIAVAWAIFRRLRRRRPGPSDAERLERLAAWAVAAALGVSGGVTLLLSVRRAADFAPGGDVRLGLLVAVLGLLTNGWFWRRYAGFARERPGRLMDGQRTLYRAKVAVDACVIAALASVALAPGRPATRWIDLAGSVAVALYLLWSAVRAAAGRGATGAADAAAPPRPVAPRRG
ncbi:MAG: cation transporter [Trueperaceae bacterium]|nr:cation transporter [Trueperaceae bacterium]